MVSLQRKGACRIMCLGESTTFSGGSRSYPAQLEEILNARQGKMRFSVINVGRPGALSRDILSQLENNINRYKPDMVIVMMGINDGDEKAVYSRPELFLGSMKVYKLINLLRVRILSRVRQCEIKETRVISRPRKKMQQLDGAHDLESRGYLQEAWNYMADNELDKAEGKFRKAIEANPANYEAYVDLGWCYRSQGMLNEAEAIYRKAVELEPYAERAYFGLGGICMDLQRLDYAEEAFLMAVKIDPVSDKAYAALALIYKNRGRDTLARECAIRAENLRLGYYNPLTRGSYLGLKEILDRRGIPLICVQYPMRSIGSLKKIFSGREGVVFVDNEEIFKEALRNGRYGDYFTDIFAGDFGHCTDAGNRLIAENIAEVILKDYFNSIQRAQND